MTIRSEIVLPHALAQHISWAGDTNNHLPPEHLEPGGTVNKINQILLDRALEGLDTYGTYLMSNNERDAVRDLIDELADAFMYVTQIQLQGNGVIPPERLKRIQHGILELLHTLVPSWADTHEDDELAWASINQDKLMNRIKNIDEGLYREYMNGEQND
jgi:hypothetical protein